MMEIGIISDRSVIFMTIGDLIPKINISLVSYACRTCLPQTESFYKLMTAGMIEIAEQYGLGPEFDTTTGFLLFFLLILRFNVGILARVLLNF